MNKKSIRFFNDRKVRVVWDDENSEGGCLKKKEEVINFLDQMCEHIEKYSGAVDSLKEAALNSLRDFKP